MLKAADKLGIVFFPAYDWSLGPTHPEREERLLYTHDQLVEEGVFDIEGIEEFKPTVASREDIERVHFCFPDVDSVCTRSHMASAGGAIKAAELVMSGESRRAFALVRPPGHHAMKSVHGTRGFCTVNIEAVMIEWIREHYGPKRVAVVDTDCHHGDGTQDVYWHDPDTLYISLHQDGRTLYPGSGFPDELGGPRARGRTINIPLPPGTSDEGFLHVIDNVVLPLLDDFKPDLIVNSAGQDNHFTDPITNMNFSAHGYALMNEKLRPDIAVLEGGYAIQGALPYVNLGIVLAMAGLDYSQVVEPDWDPERWRQSKKITQYIEALSAELPKLYFRPPPEKETLVGGWHVRMKEIFYDTDGIHESQREMLLDCRKCRGTLKIETRSGRIPLSLGIEIPADACPTCRAEGYRAFEDAQLKGGYRYVQLINRADKEYQRIGF
ncbi:Histone deacetylase domain containing protein [Desulfovibrio sp. X2]|uniref:histone deacetylase family protein n=1 Tax=Desulfovibrio sp. X2 TaxID=941449 RepID=UPI0003588857|nr:histone deacetylase [Desulfovibrio sp. X2]EPR44717.1 Histone deacetylase domain containing protein [Desulfovibrio sp. X2]